MVKFYNIGAQTATPRWNSRRPDKCGVYKWFSPFNIIKRELGRIFRSPKVYKTRYSQHCLKPGLDRFEVVWTLLGQCLDSVWTEWDVTACRNLGDSQTSESSKNSYDATGCRNVGDSQTPESSKSLYSQCTIWHSLDRNAGGLDTTWTGLGEY